MTHRCQHRFIKVTCSCCHVVLADKMERVPPSAGGAASVPVDFENLTIYSARGLIKKEEKDESHEKKELIKHEEKTGLKRRSAASSSNAATGEARPVEAQRPGVLRKVVVID